MVYRVPLEQMEFKESKDLLANKVYRVPLARMEKEEIQV
jgi:hypothetical protein